MVSWLKKALKNAALLTYYEDFSMITLIQHD